MIILNMYSCILLLNYDYLFMRSFLSILCSIYVYFYSLEIGNNKYIGNKNVKFIQLKYISIHMYINDKN